MDIRSDYVRSLSSASFTLELRFEAVDGKCATMHLAVSSGVCFSADGDMKADVVYLYPEQNGTDITVGNQSIYSVTDLNTLCDLLFASATIKGWHDPRAAHKAYAAKVHGLNFAIDGKLKYYGSHKELAERIEKLGGKVSRAISSEIDYLICNYQNSASRKKLKASELGIPVISDFEFAWGLFGKDPYRDSPEDRNDDGITMSVKDAAPITIENFKKACAEAGITLANLRRITIQNNKFGTGDSAMFVLSNNDKFYAYKKMYTSAPDEEKESIAEEFIAWVKAGPVLDVNDNEFELPETMHCVWNGSDEILEKEMLAYLEGNDPGHWMGTYSMEFTIDVAKRKVTSREVLFFGDV